jgi:C_GCAxxG_C_C family probable redox protein
VLERAGSLAEERFAQFNCAESSFWGVAQALGLPRDDALLCACTPFGAGIGQACATCGALSGAVLALGVALGRTTPDAGRKAVAYAAARQLFERFTAGAGDYTCAALNPQGFDWPDLRAHCVRFVILAARLAAEILLDATAPLE